MFSEDGSANRRVARNEVVVADTGGSQHWRHVEAGQIVVDVCGIFTGDKSGLLRGDHSGRYAVCVRPQLQVLRRFVEVASYYEGPPLRLDEVPERLKMCLSRAVWRDGAADGGVRRDQRDFTEGRVSHCDGGRPCTEIGARDGAHLYVLAGCDGYASAAVAGIVVAVVFGRVAVEAVSWLSSRVEMLYLRWAGFGFLEQYDVLVHLLQKLQGIWPGRDIGRNEAQRPLSSFPARGVRASGEGGRLPSRCVWLRRGRVPPG